MIQEILMWLSVVGAFVYALFSLGKLIYNTSNNKGSVCSSGCGGCSAKRSLLKQIDHKSLKLG
ncbi:FeoB-associated Cys-rich membrane protein [Plebeiibacterium sediminum]|uniref:FeoB-associated Cys-rich membrane protein n=1 Tax=Plebeiibacterium sediminum TaxID=2992112 RepID=A0AAE3SG99_9BACT|nr:FeoB-associated Cys-rich membrane protein [Plebeiobacterium sediminum]MCW3788101.1 FeoB-associated Cys-rich membrane protein [Plebeiobacterium sediminum]